MTTHEDRIEDLLQVLCQAYPSQKFGPDNIRTYTMLLGRYPVEAVEAAVFGWIHDGGAFFPSAPELIGRIGEHAVGTIAGFPTGDAGWAEVCRVRKAVGSYRGMVRMRDGELVRNWPGWSHPAIERAVQFVGGWEAICLCDFDDEPSQRARFVAHLNTLRDQRRREIQLDPTDPGHRRLGEGETDDGIALGGGR